MKLDEKLKSALTISLLLQLLTDVVICFDIAIVRQVLGFIYLTFFPGFVLVKVLKMDREQDKLETFLFSAGLSIAILMILGILTNAIGELLSFHKPLSLLSLIIVVNIFTFGGLSLVYLLNNNSNSIEFKRPCVDFSTVLLMLLPLLGVIGSIYMNVSKDNRILFLLILLISLTVIVMTFNEKISSPKIYPFVIISIALSLLMHSTFISEHIIPYGSDVPGEYFLFRTVENNGHWNLTLPSSFNVWYGRLNAMLSVTILPTFYAEFLNIGSEWIFKLLYPLIFSLVPLGFYHIWQTYLDKKHAFLSTFLLVAQQTFYIEMLGLNRQMIAELFFILLLLVILSTKIKTFGKTLSFALFSFGLIASHYGLAVIFLVFISFTFILFTLMKRNSKNVTVYMVISFFVLMFAWYIFTSSSATFNSILEFGDYVYRQVNDFLNPESRGQAVLTGLGLSEAPTIWNFIGRIFAYLTEVFIVIGFIGLITKRVRTKIKGDSLVFIVCAMLFLIMLIAIPGLANTLRMSRFYHVLLFFLAPLCVIGADLIVKLFLEQKRKMAVLALILLVLIPYFLFQTEFIYEITGSDSWSIALSGYRMNVLRLYVLYGYPDAYGVYGAEWASKFIGVKNITLYGDERTLINVLTMYGGNPGGNPLSNTTLITQKSTVFLSTLNVIYEKVPYEHFLWNISELAHVFDDLDLIYINGGSEIYKCP